MLQLFHTIIYQPIYNALIYIYNVVPGHDLGLAIIILTVIVRLILYPVAKKQIESQKRLQAIQPEIKKIQEKYRSDKEKQSRMLMQLYKERKANPAAGCLPLIIQLIFFIALYQAFIAGINFSQECKDLYSFVSCPEGIRVMFLGFLDITKPNIVLAVIAAAAQYIQTKMMTPVMPASSGKSDISSIMGQQMLYLGPILTLFIGIRFPAGLAIYWIVNTVFAIVQQYLTAGAKNVPSGDKQSVANLK
ncbi:MAG: YidC/Oxa1 family membrane protein insertase [Parcubacteria group bacterium]|jgi:YidC/Oxa1 family membrane protein insertase